ncbi:MAG: hypothetical protein V3S12_03225 [Acidiferrobacterales bacterium]
MFVGVCFAFGISLPAHSAITTVVTSPNSTNVPLSHSTSVVIGWSVTTNTAGAVTVSSTQGVFRTPGGVMLGIVNKTLSKSVNGPASVTFNEVVLVPANIIYRAHKLGFNNLRYERSFTDGFATAGQITLFIVGSSAATFSVTRLALKFDDDSPLRIVSRYETLKAHAGITVVGSGLLRATWEFAGPDFNVDNPVFRPLKTVHRYLSAGDEITVMGPELPTQTTGVYLVQLRVTKPQPGFKTPVIQYSVQSPKDK